MKTTMQLIVVPLLCAAGAAMAQEGQSAPAGEPTAAQEQVRSQEQAGTRKKVERQGADMRHCLDRKDSKAIIRCAEPGRKP